MSDAPKSKDGEPDHDVVLVHGKTEDGAGLRALRSRRGSLALTELRPVREGQALAPTAELVRLRERKESPALWDVDVLYAPREGDGDGKGHEGPARVSSDRYRRNWDQVFGTKRSHKTSAN